MSHSYVITKVCFAHEVSFSDIALQGSLLCQKKAPTCGKGAFLSYDECSVFALFFTIL